MITLYRLISGLWQGLGVPSIVPPEPPPDVGYGLGGYGTQPYGT